jgi:hypothetical protein
VAELSIAKFAAQVTREEPDIVGLPVVCSRVFRFGAFYLNRRSGIETARICAASGSARRSGPTPPPSTCAAGCTTRSA